MMNKKKYCKNITCTLLYGDRIWIRCSHYDEQAVFHHYVGMPQYTHAIVTPTGCRHIVLVRVTSIVGIDTSGFQLKRNIRGVIL